MDIPSFASVEEELQFWKEKALSFKHNFDELKQDFDDYQDDSQALEQELDTQLKQEERKNRDLADSAHMLQDDNKNLRSRLEQITAELNARTSEWMVFRKTEEEINQYVRQLEQKNDNLEQANRAAAMSIEDFEAKLDQAIERNVDLESELDERDSLKGMVQRLKEEARDLRYELQIAMKDRSSRECLDSDSTHLLECATTPQFNSALAQTSASPVVRPRSMGNSFLKKLGLRKKRLRSPRIIDADVSPPKRKFNSCFR